MYMFTCVRLYIYVICTPGLLQEAIEQLDQCDEFNVILLHLIDTQFYLLIIYYDIRFSVVEK